MSSLKRKYLLLFTTIALALRDISAFITPPNHHPVRFWNHPTHSNVFLPTVLFHSSGNGDEQDNERKDFNKEEPSSVFSRMSSAMTLNPQRSLYFSIGMTLAGAALGPFLDTYHSTFGVLHYDHPITAALWSSSPQHPALITAWWVPELFGVAGVLIGWLYILLDAASSTTTTAPSPSVPNILVGISFFTFQYWFSGVLVAAGVDRGTILNIMSIMAASGFLFLDGTWTGLVTSTATALGGPLIEIALLSLSRAGALGGDGYAYTDLGETGFFPLWICPVYFLGGPANGNLARGLWNALSIPSSSSTATDCQVCQNTRTVPCPNCDGKGDYVAMGGRRISCTSCRGRGFVICRDCFGSYGEDPYDIEAIREKMSRMPD